MAERKLQQIQALYGEILGMADHLPSDTVNLSLVKIYNSCIDELNSATENDYSRFKASDDDAFVINDTYWTSSLKPKMGGLLARLEQEFGFSKPQRGTGRPSTNIITIHNNNQLSVTVVPIQEILQGITDPDLRADVEELRDVIEGDKSKQRASSLLNTIQQKSWDIFLALLPLVLERLGKS